MNSFTSQENARRLTLAGLGLLVLLGAYLRIHDLGAMSISHPEMYVPGIRMPPELSQPTPRLTLAKVLSGTFSSDTHPPAYYVLMLAWTKICGVGIRSIRLPSALLGVACIPLVFWLGTLTRQREAGFVTAALLAMNGYHVFWSRVARMFSLACFLGLLATILLLLLAREPRARLLLQLAYAVTLLLGLCSHVFFWLILSAHMLWTFLTAQSQRRAMPGLLKLQILILVFGSSLLAFAAYQSGTGLAELSSNVLIYAREFIQFAFLFPLQGFSSGVFLPAAPYPPPDNPHVSLPQWLFVAFSVLLLALGIASIEKSDQTLLVASSGPSRKVWIAGGMLASLMILIFVYMADAFAKPAPNPTLHLSRLMLPLPLLLAGCGILLLGLWERIPAWVGRLASNRFVSGEQALVLMLAVLPFAILSLTSLFKPLLNARGMLFAAPYILLLLAAGIVRLAGRPWLAVPVVAVLVFVHAQSLIAYRRMGVDPVDFKRLAAEMAPDVEKSDLIFFRPSWASTPILYYLSADRYRLFGKDFGEVCRQNPRARVWTLIFYREDFPEETQEALAAYHVVKTIEVPHSRAVLYAPRTP